MQVDLTWSQHVPDKLVSVAAFATHEVPLYGEGTIQVGLYIGQEEAAHSSSRTDMSVPFI